MFLFFNFYFLIIILYNTFYKMEKNLNLPKELNIKSNLRNKIKNEVSLKLNDFNIELYQYILQDLQYKDASDEYQNEIKIFLEKELKKFITTVFK